MVVRLRFLVAAAILLAGCGGGSPAKRPDDFALSFRHADGTVAPPDHAEWSLAVAPDGDAQAGYIPDYPGPEVLTFRARVRLTPAQLDRLYGELDRRGLLDEGLSEPDDVPVGGDRDSATVTAGGEVREIPAFGGDGQRPLEPLVDDIRGLIPERTWRSFLQRRDEYAMRRYGRRPADR